MNIGKKQERNEEKTKIGEESAKVDKKEVGTKIERRKREKYPKDKRKKEMNRK